MLKSYNHMKKKAQVTIFIIIAIVIVAAIIAYFSIDNFSVGRSSPQFNEINDIVKDCAEIVGQDMTYFIGQTGGYYETPQQVTQDGVAYYYNGRNTAPSKERIEQEMSRAHSEMIFYCLNDFENMTNSVVTDFEIYSKVILEDEMIYISTNYEVTQISNDKTSIISEDINTEIPSGVGTMYNSAIEVIENYGEEICLSCITDIALQNQVKIDITKPSDTTYFTITDQRTQVNGVPVEWIFAYEE